MRSTRDYAIQLSVHLSLQNLKFILHDTMAKNAELTQLLAEKEAELTRAKETIISDLEQQV